MEYKGIKMSLRDLKADLKTSVNYQAQHNSFAAQQFEREVRVRKNLNELERLQNRQSQAPPIRCDPYAGQPKP